MATPSKNRPPKPGKNYFWNGREWVWIQQKGPPKKTVKPQPPKPGKPPKTQTTEQWAESESTKIINAQLAAIEEQQKAWREQLETRARQQTEQAQRFAEMVKGMGIDKQIQGIFSNAGHDVAGYGAGFSGEMRELAAAGAAEQLNMLSGTGQEGAIRDQGENMGNVIHGVGGFIPSATLAAQGAAYASDAAMQPGFMLQQRVGDAQKALQEGLADNPFLDAIMQTKLGKQEIKSGLIEQKTSLNLKQREMQLEQLDKDRKYWLAMQQYYLDVGKLKLAKQAEQRAQQAQNRYDQEARGMTPDGNVAPGFYRDPKTGRIIQNGYRPDGTRISSSTTGGKKGGMTPNMQAEQLEKVYNAEDDIKSLARTLATEIGWSPSSGRNQKNWNKIAAEIRRRYGWVTTTKGKKALTDIIKRTLTAMSKMGPPAPGGADAGGGGAAVDPYGAP